MARVCLRRRREDRLRQLIALPKSLRQRDAAHGPSVAIFLPTRAGQIPASNALNLDHVGAFDKHRPSFQRRTMWPQHRGVLLHIRGDDMVWDETLQEVEPEKRHAIEHLA